MFNIIIWEVRYKAFCASKLAQKLYEPCTLTRFRCAYAYCACDFPNVRILFIYLTDYSRSGSQFTRAGRTAWIQIALSQRYSLTTGHTPELTGHTLQNLRAKQNLLATTNSSAFTALTINYGEPWTLLTTRTCETHLRWELNSAWTALTNNHPHPMPHVSASN